MDSVELSGYHEDGRGRLSGILQSLPLAHGFLATNDHGVGVVDDAVVDRIRQQRVGQLFWPAWNIELGAEDRGVSLVSVLHDFELVPGFCFHKGIQKPFVNYEQCVFLILGHELQPLNNRLPSY